jgi:hypothetical protein
VFVRFCTLCMCYICFPMFLNVFVNPLNDNSLMAVSNYPYHNGPILAPRWAQNGPMMRQRWAHFRTIMGPKMGPSYNLNKVFIQLNLAKHAGWQHNRKRHMVSRRKLHANHQAWGQTNIIVYLQKNLFKHNIMNNRCRTEHRLLCKTLV